MLTALLSLLIVGAPLEGRSARPPAGSPGRSWGPEQATGAPDVPRPNTDDVHAWAPMGADSGEEWLQLTYEQAVRVSEVRIYESLGGGFVTRIVAVREQGEVTLWSGRDETPPGGTLAVRADPQVESNQIRIYLDTRRRLGWEEIDAVQLVGTDGSRQWARSATASSSYADLGGGVVAVDPFAGLIGQRATVHLTSGAALSGEVKARSQGALRLEEGEHVWVISEASVAYVEWGRR